MRCSLKTTHVLVEFKPHADRGDVAELYRIGKLYEKVVGKKPRRMWPSKELKDAGIEW